jgi:hypothetical protein
MLASERDHPVAHRNEALDLGAHALPGLAKIEPNLAHLIQTGRLPAVRDPREGTVGLVDRLNLGRISRPGSVVSDELSNIDAARHAEQSADDLHVLLRHPLLPYPGGFERFGDAPKHLDAGRFAITDGG